MIVRRDSALHVAFEGLDIYDYTAGREGPSSFGVIDVPAGAGHRTAYSRRSDKYYYVVAGKLTFALDGEQADLGPGDLCFVAAGRRFAYHNSTAATASVILVHTPPFDVADEVFVD